MYLLSTFPPATADKKNHFEEPLDKDKAIEYEECHLVFSESSSSFDGKFQESSLSLEPLNVSGTT